MQLEAASGLAPTSEPSAAPAAIELTAEEAAAAAAKREKYAAIAAAKREGYAKVEAEQRAKDEEAVADRVKAAISQGEITAITAAEFDLLRAGAAAALQSISLSVGREPGGPELYRGPSAEAARVLD